VQTYAAWNALSVVAYALYAFVSTIDSCYTFLAVTVNKI